MPASASRFREARFLGTRLQRSKFKKQSRLRLRLQADSEKPNSSAQTSEEANSKELLCAFVFQQVQGRWIPRRKAAKKQTQGSSFASASSSRFEEAGFLDARLQRSKFKKQSRSLKTR
ncbi:hypothetical protein GT3570_01390 [Geobacillus thermoleovorans]|nr:hypothetical protein GT3570_01390 [Geobacillus thermoleovorans]